jgi:hypothetical protein
LLAQNIYEKANPTTRDAKGRVMDRYLTDELKTFTVYGCRVIVTNTSSSTRDCQLLMQVRLEMGRDWVETGKGLGRDWEGIG